MSLQLPVGPESQNIYFQAFSFPEGGVFSLASEESDNSIKYCRDFRMKEEVQQDKKEKAKRRHLPLPCSSFLASCWVIYPHFGGAERVQGKLEDRSGLNSHFFSEALVKKSPPAGWWLTPQLDTITTTPTPCSEWEPAGTGGVPDCHPPVQHHLRALFGPSSSPRPGLQVRALNTEPGCPLPPLPPPLRRPPGLCVLKAHSFHSVKNKPACAPLQRRPSPQRPRVGCCCRSALPLLK